MLAKVKTAAVVGLDAQEVQVEVDIMGGLQRRHDAAGGTRVLSGGAFSAEPASGGDEAVVSLGARFPSHTQARPHYR